MPISSRFGGQKIEDEPREKGLPKKYKSRQALWFHCIMVLFSCYAGVMFTSWIHISVSNVQQGSAIVDDLSIWVRSIATLLVILYAILKLIRSQWNSEDDGQMEESEEEYEEGAVSRFKRFL